jgi:hypothetical protein
MRDAYELTSFLRALDAWEQHRELFLKRLRDARQPEPPPDQLLSYRNIFIEGWLECDANKQTTSG